MENPSYILSKTAFLKLEQCEKAYYFYRKMPYLRDKVDTDKQLTFLRGHTVGFKARELFPNGVEGFTEGMTIDEAVKNTQQLVLTGASVIYEAAFIYNQILVITDILVKEDGHYLAYEVKSSLKVSETYLKDACLQFYVMHHCLDGFEDMFLVTINPEFRANSQASVKELFKKRSVKEKALENFSFFDFKVGAARQILDKGIVPDVATGLQCFRPYQCDFFGTCWKNDLTERSVFNLPLIDKGVLLEWFHSGWKTFDVLPNEAITKPIHRKIKEALTTNTIVIDEENLKIWNARLRGYTAAFDIEVWAPAIPEIEGTRPFEQIPFLISVHNENGSFSYMADYEFDDRKAMATFICDKLSHYETLLVYDKTLEVGVLNQLASLFPELKVDIKAIESKIIDVFDVVINGWYYHPKLLNNFSLKKLSSLISEEQYTDVTSGLEAMYLYTAYRTEQNTIEKELLRQRLVHYCELDAQATYSISRYFQSLLK